MTIPTTRLNIASSVERLRRNLVHLQEDIRANAAAHKAAADDDAVAGHIGTCITAYRTRLKWVTDIVADPARRAHMQAQLARVGWDEADVTDVSSALAAAVERFAASPKATPAQVIAACDALLADVGPLEVDPETVWPE